MPKSCNIGSTFMPRRSLLDAATPTLTGNAAPGPDAELIGICATIVANRAEMDRYSDEFDSNEPPSINARVRVLVDEGHRLSEQVAEMRATTLDGTKAKAVAMLTYMGDTSDGDLLWSSHNELLAWSIARDLLRSA